MATINRCKAAIAFVVQQIESLDHYLPETYEMLMHELDQQSKNLKQLELQQFYREQSHE